MISQAMIPPLTTIHQPNTKMGQTAVKQIVSWIQSGVQPTESIMFEPELVVRDSVSVKKGEA